MGVDVFANGMEVACKAGAGKSICAFPDVCLTPPSPPAGPLPIPYPNTGMDSDTDGGSKTVQVKGKEIMLKDKSSFKKSTGDEAATNGQGANVITHKIKGKCYFKAWSMDVKVEGENVVRNLDIITHNHGSDPPGTPPWPFMASMAVATQDPCAADKAKEEEACKDYAPKGSKDVCKEAGLDGPIVQSTADAQSAGFTKSKDWAADKSKKAAANDCASARRCKLSRYDAPKDGVNGCCKSQTADHIVPKSSFYVTSVNEGTKLSTWPKYDMNAAPCMCAEGASNTVGSHGLRHAHHKANGPGKGTMTPFKDEVKLAAQGATEVFKSSGCDQGCIEEQLKNGHNGMGDQNSNVKHCPSGSTMSNQEISSQASQLSPTVVAP